MTLTQIGNGKVVRMPTLGPAPATALSRRESRRMSVSVRPRGSRLLSGRWTRAEVELTRTVGLASVS